MEKTVIEVNSEIGKLEGVIIHSPGSEVENMTPNMVQRALYSDILNLSVAGKEYNQFRSVLENYTTVYEMRNLLCRILEEEKVKTELVNCIVDFEGVGGLRNELLGMDPVSLTSALVEGVELRRDNLSRFLSQERFELEPLHNFFFTRDASMTLGDRVFISKMASRVRHRESMIMKAIFDHHPAFVTRTVSPYAEGLQADDFSFEGGDFIVAREDILLIGTGLRTSPKAIDYLIEYYKARGKKMHIIVQELPYEPESFIHLDMVFTFLDKDLCMIYEPLIMHSSRFLTIHIAIDNGKVKINEVPNIVDALRNLGMDLKTVNCGGPDDLVSQEREQWHSGANFFALAPGKIMGYGRNIYTLEELNRNGFEVLRAKDIIAGKADMNAYDKCVISIEGAELARGGGGCRCMTMPVRRAAVDW